MAFQLFSQKTKKLAASVSALLFFAVLIFLSSEVFADGVNQYKGSGYAYGAIDDDGDSEADTGIGYISFGCETDVSGACEDTATGSFPTGYGVRIETNPDSPDVGKFFGYAWSSNYGWVSFFHNDVQSCGAGGGLEIPGDVQNFLQSTGDSVILDGWARVLNHDDDYWDGCIRFGEDAVNGFAEPTRLTNVSSDYLEMSGWAYGHPVVGWISFDCDECRVAFTPSSTPDNPEPGCEDINDPDSCDGNPSDGGGDGGGTNPDLVLYVGSETTNPINVTSSTLNIPYQGSGSSATIQLTPRAFNQDVYSCVASYSATQNGIASGWGGTFDQPTMNPLVANEGMNISNYFFVDLVEYTGDEIYNFTIDCLTVANDEPVSAFASVTITYPSPVVSITANPNVVEDGGSSTISWNATFVEDGSCSITGWYDTVPEPQEGQEDPDAFVMDSGYADAIGFDYFGSLSVSDQTESDDVFGLNWPTAFVITCDDYQGNEVSDVAIVGVGEYSCTESFEELGLCGGNPAPIFEEF